MTVQTDEAAHVGREQYIKSGDAMRLLRISRYRMTRMLAEGEVEWTEDLLDRRVVLIPLREVERLRAQTARSAPSDGGAAATAG